MNQIFSFISYLENFYWSYIGWVLITVSGVYLTFLSKGLQFRVLWHFRKNIKTISDEANHYANQGIHPFKLYFASVGGMVGLGNIVFISTAVMIGGPGSIVWTILASLAGMLLKYSEIYLGVKYRIRNTHGEFEGGPMYFLQKSFKSKAFAYIFAVLLCLYGVEISNFLILVDRIEHSFALDRYLVIMCLLAVVIYSAIGGINRLANICSFIMPVFMISYVLLCLYVIACNISTLPAFCKTVLISSITGHAPIGGFIGSTMVLSAYLGMSKSVYSGDIGIGYDSVMQSTTCIIHPEKQATLAIYALFTDTLICILTNVMVGVTGAWYTLNDLNPSDIVASLVHPYVPFADYFMTLILFFAGYTTLIAYLAAGTKSAEFINAKYGKVIYLLYAVFAFIFFCNFSQVNVMIIMGLLSGLLVLLNVCGILKLSKDINFQT